jgi:ATP-dependent Clp protease ATP-binding subunit ClpA
MNDKIKSVNPEKLLGYTVWELQLSNIVVGSGIVGEVEKKTKAILDFAQDPKNKVKLFLMRFICLLVQVRPTKRLLR